MTRAASLSGSVEANCTEQHNYALSGLATMNCTEQTRAQGPRTTSNRSNPDARGSGCRLVGGDPPHQLGRKTGGRTVSAAADGVPNPGGRTPALRQPWAARPGYNGSLPKSRKVRPRGSRRRGGRGGLSAGTATCTDRLLSAPSVRLGASGAASWRRPIRAAFASESGASRSQIRGPDRRCRTGPRLL